ncbi:VPLPA-CTERM-specific exosortase XrtD [Lichenihabitans sp. Uapishka_5]|uniref:VPLPA-CTERM-specific exosortase XrtD n=1 Tax=Lichenihabitans sp. Uapishka_5 TaxID=3037302 RepID=UPI0029E7D711|nr:VPLPA-CTERM-specific exosortase XrtD [Lichenihabitans sp. Uapishka_5]MDX7950404.1 VPLPA-CTERM-specific exosortase XrtD [Lichenihabitans sp. Uapishka_5]
MSNATQSLPSRAGRGFRAAPALALLALGCVITAVLPGLRFISDLWGREEYSHVYLILPLAVLIFLYRFPQASLGGTRWPAIVLAVLSLVTMAIGDLSGLYTISVYGGLVGIVALVWSAVGARGMWTLGGPTLYLGFMIPLPKALYLTLSTEMQHLSSQIGVAGMTALGLNVFLDGNIIDLGGAKLEVAEACNGLRYLFPLVSFGCLIAMLLEDAWWKKVVLIVSTLPIAVLMNAGRITMIGILVDRYGIGMAEGTQHEVEGFLVFFLCILVLLVEVWLLLKVGARGRFLALDVLLPDRAALSAIGRWPMSSSFLATGLLLVLGAVSVTAMPRRAEVIPPRQSFSLFPMQVGSWVGAPQVMGSEFLSMLQLTDYVLADYARPGTDVPVNFYAAYYESQRFGIQSHSPQQCIPGGGWNIETQSLIQIQAEDGTSIPVNRLRIERQGVRQIAYFWFDERGRSMTNDFQLRYYAIHDALLNGRSDGALVRLVTPMVDGDEAAADTRLQQFFLNVSGVIGKYVPN